MVFISDAFEYRLMLTPCTCTSLLVLIQAKPSSRTFGRKAAKRAVEWNQSRATESPSEKSRTLVRRDSTYQRRRALGAEQVAPTPVSKQIHAESQSTSGMQNANGRLIWFSYDSIWFPCDFIWFQYDLMMSLYCFYIIFIWFYIVFILFYIVFIWLFI